MDPEHLLKCSQNIKLGITPSQFNPVSHVFLISNILCPTIYGNAFDTFYSKLFFNTETVWLCVNAQFRSNTPQTPSVSTPCYKSNILYTLLPASVTLVLSVHVGLIFCKTAWTFRQTATFRTNILNKSSALKMEVVCTSETFVSACKFTRRYNPDDQYLHLRDNLKSYSSWNIFTGFSPRVKALQKQK